MPELGLAARFPSTPTEAWEAAIQNDLKGADYQRKLYWSPFPGLAVRPYYRRADVTAATGVARTPGWAADVELPAGAIDASRWHEAGATPVQELAFALSEIVEQMAAGGVAPALRLGVGPYYFVEIAKFRAARLCWARVVEAFGQGGLPLVLHARTSMVNKSAFDPETNLLRATTEALAAAIGGCDAIAIAPAGFSPALAANVHHILREEAHIGEIEDPAAGCYYLENLTESIGRAAWELFQSLESAGGFSAAQGEIEYQLTVTRRTREQEFALRKTVLTGVNQYPAPEGSFHELPGAGWRLAEPLEALRRRVERSPRTVLLLTRGDRKMSLARAAFCQGFFGAAGLRCVESSEMDASAGLIVLCAADADYLALAPEAVAAAGGLPVVVAGNPREQIPALEAAGIAGFVHLGSDQPATLAQWLDRMGVPA